MPLNLSSQELFETLWFHRDAEKPAIQGMRASDRKWIVQFSASWCGPCKRLDAQKLDATSAALGLPLWKCDVDENDYTPGFCQVRSIPTFMCFVPGKVISTLQSSSTDEVIAWMKQVSQSAV